MPYLMRLNVRPDADKLTNRERSQITREFDTYAGEVRIHGESVGWNEITEVELVKAPTLGGLSAAILGMFVNTGDRYHLGVYLGRDEAVLANITEDQARYVLHTIAYYAPQPIGYIAKDDIAPLIPLVDL